jgi:hypothetical protein
MTPPRPVYGSVDALRAATLCTHCQQARRMQAWPAEHPYVDPPQPDVCRACWEQWWRAPATAAEEQTRDALDLLGRKPERFVRWPFAALDALAGPIAPGTVWGVGAASGGGKTTFVASCVRRWIDAKVRVAVLPLEIRPSEWRVHFACLRVGVYPGDMLSGELRLQEAAGVPGAKEARARVWAEVRAMESDPTLLERLYLAPDRVVNERTLRTCVAHAAGHGFQVVVVDHIDHVGDEDAGASRSELDVSKRVNQALLAEAQRHDVALVFTSQLNASRTRGAKDKLAKYAAPVTQDLYLHTFKEHNATGLIGLFRPLAPDADPDAVARARAGDRPPADVLEPLTMGVTAMKLRNYGGREGNRVYLAVEHGQARDRTLDEARAWEARSHGVRTDGTVLPFRRPA